MTKILVNILITIIISTIGSIGAYKYAPMSWFETEQAPKFGTTITTINGSDTLSNSRTTINDNFTALNNGKIEVGTTSVNSITALNNLATVGTITSGTWTGSVIDVARQGTGTTSPTSNQVIIGNGASGFKVVGFGTSGQFLTSGGNGVAPSWTTGGIDQTLDYNFTGSAFRVKSLIASTTISFSNGGLGVSYVFPPTQGASSTALVNNGSGTLSWIPTSRLIATSSPLSYTSSSATSTRFSVTLPANSLGSDNLILIKDEFADISQSSGNAIMWEVQYGSQNKTFVLTNSGVDSSVCISGSAGPSTGYFEIILSANGPSSQTILAKVYCDSAFSTTFTPTYKFTGSMSVDSTSNQTLTLNVRTKGNGANDRYNSDVLYSELIAK